MRPQNLLANSNGAAGTLTNVTRTIGIADPWGTNLAQRFTETVANGAHNAQISNGVAHPLGTVSRASCFLKYIDTRYVHLLFDTIGATFDLVAGAWASNSPPTSLRAWIRPVGGWWRVSVIGVPTFLGLSGFAVIAHAGGAGGIDYPYLGFGFAGTGRSFDCAGFQLEAFRSVPLARVTPEPGDYIPTTGVAYNYGPPRLVGF